MKAKTIKHDKQYDEAIERAEEDFRNADGREMKEKCPYLFSSNMADAYWITAYCLYCTGKKPYRLHKSKGYDWIVDFPGHGLLIGQAKTPDHRFGIVMRDLLGFYV